MATLLHNESRRMYSWWWDSHISPKNSKWLQENLTDMDAKVKAMIKLIEEDADSFARRAEMYYKKRPELMKLVEEFYRAYRALAERYDHATGELRQAHRTMAEAFPNQIPFSLSDDFPSSPSEAEPHTPEMPHPLRALLDPDDLQKDALGLSSHSLASKRSGTYTDDSDIGTGRKGLKQLNEMFAEVRARKGLNFQEEDKKGPDYKLPGMSQKHKLEEKEKKIRSLQEELLKLSIENQSLNSRVSLESERAGKAETEVQTLHKFISEVELEKQAAFLRYQECLERVSNLEAEIARVQEDASRLSEKILAETTKLAESEERCLLMEGVKHSLQVEVDTLVQKTQMQGKEISEKDEELEKIKNCMKEEQLFRMQAEESLLSLQNLHTQSQEEHKKLALELQNTAQTSKEMETIKSGLEDELKRIKSDNHRLAEEYLSAGLLIKNLKDEIFNLKEAKCGLEEEVRLRLGERDALEQKLCCLKEKIEDSERRYEHIISQVGSVGLNVGTIQSSVKDLQDENLKLKEIGKKEEDEKVVLLGRLQDMEKLLQKNSLLESSLLAANAELDGLREKLRKLEESFKYVQEEKFCLLTEKDSLVCQVEKLIQSTENLSEKNISLANSLADVNVELEALQKDLETKSEELSILGDENQKLLEMSKQLSENLKASHLQEEILKSETDVLSRQLSESVKAYQTLSNENFELLEENQSWKKEFCYLRDDKYILEEEYNVVLEESLTLSVLYLAAMSFGTEKSAELKWLYGNLDQLRRVNIDLKKEVGVTDAKIGRVEMENLHLKESIKKLEECRSLSLVLEEKLSKASGLNEELNRESEILKIMLVQREMELSDALQKIKAKETENIGLCKAAEALKEADKVARTIREDLEKKIVMLSKDKTLQNEEIVCLREANVHLDQEMSEFQKELEELKTREKHLKFELLQMVDEAELSEVIAADLHKDLQISNVRSAIFEEKVYELLGKYEKEVVDQKTRIENLKSELQEKVDESEVWETEAAELYRGHHASSTCAAIFEHKVYKLIQELQEEVVDQKTMNKNLKSELQEKVSEAEVWETEAAELYRDLQTSSTCAAICEHKVYELTHENGNLEKSTTIQKEMLEKESSLKEAEIRELKRIVDESEVWETEAAELYRGHHTSSTCAAIFEHKVYKLIQELREEVVDQKTMNENLKSELQEKVSEAEVWETEAAGLYRDLQTSSTCAAFCEHKVYELTHENGNLEKSATIQKEMLEKESALKEAEIKELKRKVGALEGENEGFRIELTAVVRLVSILGDSLSFLEEQAHSLAKINEKDDQEPQEPEAVNHQDETNTQAPEEHNVSEPSKVLELQKLQVKVRAVEKALVEIRRLSMQERSIANSNLEAAMKEIEELKSKSSGPLEVQPSKDIVVQLEEGGTEPRKDLVLQEVEAKVSDVKMKDIQLDHVSNSSSYENGIGSYAKSRREKIKAEDQILELWEPAERNGIPRPNIKNSDKVTSETTEDPVGSYRSESLEDQNFEKDMPVDKLEVPNKRMIERLASDAQRLTNLQTNMQELKHKIETSDKGTQLTGFEYDSLKGQLYEVEQTISQCVEINCKLTKNVEKEHSLSPNRKLEGLGETGHSGRKISERARRCSEKIGRLELEMQRIQFVLFKLEDEYQSKARKEAERRRRVLLRDYLYGGREGQRKKRRPFCSCVRPSTKDE